MLAASCWQHHTGGITGASQRRHHRGGITEAEGDDLVPDTDTVEIWPGLDDWCACVLGSRPVEVMFVAGHFANAVGLALADGRRVVVKRRPLGDRTYAVLAVQRRLFDAGFACPEPLGSPAPLAEMLAAADAYVASDELVGSPPVEDSAHTLARLVQLTGDPTDHPALVDPLPWVAWDQQRSSNWPLPDDLDVDLNHPPGPRWLEQAAERVRDRLTRDDALLVIGHCDWEAHNLGFKDGQISVVYDWDSLGVRSEPALAGAAAAVFASARGGPIAADLAQSEAFLEEYARLRSNWTAAHHEVAWAAGLWVLLYNARKELAGGGSGYVTHLGKELDARLHRAGV
jgi:hypothetical protein